MSMRLFCISIFLGITFLSTAQNTTSEDQVSTKILWLTMEEAQEKSKLMPRKIMLFLFTDWCIWCKRMEETTFLDETIADYINRSYYPVKFNAEEESTIQFNNQSYSYQEFKPRGVHQLAIKLMDGGITYPTISFLNENWQQIQSIPNFRPADQFEQIITYFGENYYKKTPWSSYQKSYIPLKDKIKG